MNLEDLKRDYAIVRGAYTSAKALDDHLLFMLDSVPSSEVEIRALRAQSTEISRELIREVCRLGRLVDRAKLTLEIQAVPA